MRRHSRSCCSPLVVPVVKGEVRHGYSMFSSFYLSSPYLSITTFRINNLQLRHCFCCSQFSSHSFQISLNAVLPSHSRSSSPRFSLHFLGIWSLCQCFISHSLHIMPNLMYVTAMRSGSCGCKHYRSLLLLYYITYAHFHYRLNLAFRELPRRHLQRRADSHQPVPGHSGRVVGLWRAGCTGRHSADGHLECRRSHVLHAF